MKGLVFDISTAARRQKAHQCANKLYKLQTPNWSEATHRTRYGHTIINRGAEIGKAVLLFDEANLIPLRTHYPDGTSRGKGTERIKEWVDFRFPNLTTEQETFIKNWVKNNESATLEQLILMNGGTSVNLPSVPSWIELKTEAELTADGWFNTEEI